MHSMNDAYEFNQLRDQLILQIYAASNGDSIKVERAKLYEKLAVEAAKQTIAISNSKAALIGLKLAVTRLKMYEPLLPTVDTFDHFLSKFALESFQLLHSSNDIMIILHPDYNGWYNAVKATLTENQNQFVDYFND